MTFDQILPNVQFALGYHSDILKTLEWLIINRDLYGRVRLIAPDTVNDDPETRDGLLGLAANLIEGLRPHTYTLETTVLYETNRELACQGATAFALDGYENVWVVDRLATEGDWARIEPESTGKPRVVFFSIKGGVGRSTALAATAWRLAQAGRRVLVLDLDLESPGLSSSLLSPERQPLYGITDWLVEDLVGNGGEVFDAMWATSMLSRDGEIFVVPAHGADPGEYVGKLGRVWMPKIDPDGSRQNWSQRLRRLIDQLESAIEPDVILIDSRAGIDEVAASCVTDLGARLILLFALEGSQTWNGYHILFEHWRLRGKARDIRERLQIVGATLPELEQAEYLRGLSENAYDLFAETVYDEVPAGEAIGDLWHYETANELAPHYPWAVKWHRSFAGLRSLHGRLAEIDLGDVQSIFGPLIDGVTRNLEMENIDV